MLCCSVGSIGVLRQEYEAARRPMENVHNCGEKEKVKKSDILRKNEGFSGAILDCFRADAGADLGCKMK
jgi:hypothetical protein